MQWGTIGITRSVRAFKLLRELVMDLIRRLYEEENKNYKEFCDIAEEVLTSEKTLRPAILMRQIQERKDFYQKKLSNQYPKKIEVSHIIKKLDADSLLVLKKCCPHFSNISSFQFHEHSDSSCQLVNNKDRIRDLSITKKKELKISWNPDYKACNNVFYFQVLLESEFGISQLRQKFSSQPSEGWTTDLLELENEFMPLFIVYMDQSLGVINSVNLIPFPSALRGSYHYAELVNDCSEFSGISAIDEFTRNFINAPEEKKIETISIYSGNSDIGIVYSNEDFRRWINIIHNISIVKKRLPSSDNVLMLPPNSYPTISLILNGFTRFCESTSLETSNILITDDSDYTYIVVKLPLGYRKNNVGQEILPSIINHGLTTNTETVLSILQSIIVIGIASILTSSAF